MLTEVQKQLERAFPTRKLMFPVTTTLEIRQELKAATVRGHMRLFDVKIFVSGHSTSISSMEGTCDEE